MKRLLFIILCLSIVITSKAQAPSFSTPNAAGVLLHYNIIDAANRYVEFTNSSGGSSWWLTDYTATTISVPATVVNPNNGQTYMVKRIGDYALNNSAVKHFDMPTTVEEIGRESFRYAQLQDQLIFHEGLRNVGSTCFDGGRYGSGTNLTLTLPSTCDSIGWMNFAHLYNTGTVDLSKCTRLKYLVGLNFHRGNIHTLYLPEGLLFINGATFDDNKLVSLDIPSTIRRINKGAFNDNPTLKVVSLRKLAAVPACEQGGWSGGSPFDNAHADLKIYVQTDLTKLYEVAEGWTNLAGKYREEVKIGASGYATLYLANENFEVPMGYDAFVIENITKATTPGGLDKANAKKFVAGSIIPAGQAVILKGAANQTCVYQANVSGTPVTITDNMLIGTATDQTINATGYDYYLFGNGALGQGFYRQTGHDKSSISLKAHKAGLRVPKGGGSAKAFVINFDAADTYVPTGIQSVKTPQPQSDVIYDLQGRRVTHPTRGIYIKNGKKMVFN